MPIVPKRHGTLAHRHSSPGFSLPPDSSSSSGPLIAVDAGVQLDRSLVFGAGLFLVLLVGYTFRRHIRGIPSRVAQAVSFPSSSSLPSSSTLTYVYIPYFQHTARYSPLHDHDLTTTNSDIDSPLSPISVHEEPAPPYDSSAFVGERSHVKERPRCTKPSPLHITVPPVRSSLGARAQARTASSSGETPVSTPSLVSDAGSSSVASSPPPLFSPEFIPIDADSDNNNGSSNSNSKKSTKFSDSETGVLDLASPRASRWDAIVHSYLQQHGDDNYPPLPHQQQHDILRGPLMGSSARSDILTTESPCATPPPQYTITIHSSPRSRSTSSSGSEGQGSPPVPDIILSPVPWLPREYSPPQSPPYYLSVPPRKSKSRNSTPSVVSNAPFDKEKKKQPVPNPRQSGQRVQGSNKYILNVDIKERHSLPDSSSRPSTRPNMLPHGFNVSPRRAATLPLARRLPAPQPILPVDMEAVYPTSPTKETGAIGTEEDQTSEEDTSPWLWRNRALSSSSSSYTITSSSHSIPSSHAPTFPTALRIDRRLGDFTPAGTESTKTYVNSDTKSVNRKGGMGIRVDSSSDSDDNVPLAQSLVLAIRRKKQRVERPAKATVGSSPVAQVFKKQLLGRLSALAAKARSAIEHEFESSDEEEEEEEREMETRFARGERERERELQPVGPFIIGDEE